MNILYLTHTCPYPPNRGDRIRCYHILKYLSKNHKVTLMYPSFNKYHLLCHEHLYQYCNHVIPVKQYIFRSYLSCVKSVFADHPFSIAFFYSKLLHVFIQKIFPDVAIVDCSTMAQYVVNMPYPKILDFVDIDSQKWDQYSSMTGFPYSPIYRIEARRLDRFEKLMMKQFDYCLVTSLHEKSLLGGAPHIEVLPNGVDQQYFTTPYTPLDGAIIFTGVMNYFPNSDAVIHFHREIFPLIKRQLPAAQFIIAGMHPPPEVRKLADHHTIVTGFVPDIRIYLSKAAVCVVPLRIAMGVQNKILEAMAMGVPVIATSIANRGINAKHGQEILLADDPASFATATSKLLTDQLLRETIRQNAKRFIDQNFRWETNLRRLDELIAEVAHISPTH